MKTIPEYLENIRHMLETHPTARGCYVITTNKYDPTELIEELRRLGLSGKKVSYQPGGYPHIKVTRSPQEGGWSSCSHRWETKYLFTSSYVVCSECGEEK